MAENIADILKTKEKSILANWMKIQLADSTLREDLMSNDDLREQSEELLRTFLKGLNLQSLRNTEDPAFDMVREILSGISISRARQGFSPRETGTFVFSLKQAIFAVLQEETGQNPVALLDTVLQIDKLMDDFGIVTFDTFIKGREDVILRQTDEISEISTPVIKVWDGILALPIIGTLDSARTQVVMENLLREIVETESTIAILDISGVPAVDSLVAQHLLKTVSATRLMGAECVISGIRPEIAQTIVHLGIDLSNIVTKATLASALKYALGLMKLDVRKATKPEQKS